MKSIVFFFLILLAGQDPTDMPAGRIIELVQERDRARAELLEQYEVTRDYLVINKRWNKRAAMKVRVTFQKPDEKRFEVISESGSGLIRGQVFKRLMKTEEEGMRRDSRKDNRIDATNYIFTLIREDVIRNRACYVIGVKPRRKDELLFEGRIYVDKEDFAVVRMEGSPAKKPSFWTTDIDFVREYQKLGDFWLPMSDESLTKVRVFGRTDLTVQYGPYTIVSRSLASK